MGILGDTGRYWGILGDGIVGNSGGYWEILGNTRRFWEIPGGYPRLEFWEILGNTGGYWEILGHTGSRAKKLIFVHLASYFLYSVLLELGS